MNIFKQRSVNVGMGTRRRRGGFTLIELLVASGITAMLVALMLTVVVNVMSGWSRSTGSLTTGNQARVVLDYLERDLQSVILKRDGNVWLAASIQGPQAGDGDAGIDGPYGAKWAATNGGIIKPAATSLDIPTYPNKSLPAPDLGNYRFGQAGLWLRMISNVPDDNNPLKQENTSAPRAVAYQIVRFPVSGVSTKERRYTFFRSEVRPAPMTDAVSGNPKLEADSPSTFGTGYNLFMVDGYNSTTYIDQSSPSVVRRPTRDHIIANNVIDFGVRFWTRNTTTQQLELAFPEYNGAVLYKAFAATSDTTKLPPAPVSGPITAAEIKYGFPVMADIFIRILTDEGVKQIELLEDPPAGYTAPVGGPTWWDIALKNSQVYTRRIAIPSEAM